MKSKLTIVTIVFSFALAFTGTAMPAIANTLENHLESTIMALEGAPQQRPPMPPIVPGIIYPSPPVPADITYTGRSLSLSLTNWTHTGPAPIVNGNTPGNLPTSGRTGGVAAHPTDPNTLYIAAVGGGIWKTTDGGTLWTPLTDEQATLWSYSVAVSKSNPDIVYAGTGEPTNSILSFYGRGVLKSTDAGSSWTLMGNSVFDRRTVARVVIHPTDPDTVYVATGGGVNGSAGGRGVWKTIDGGLNWTNTTTAVTGGSFAGVYSDLLMHPTDPMTLYCAVGQYSGQLKNGVYKTTNAGGSWAAAGNHPVGSANGRITIAICRDNPLVLYSIISNPATSGLLKMMKTVDGGTIWAEVLGVPNFMGGQGWYDQCIAVDPVNPDIVFVGGQSGANGILKSENGGTSWTTIESDATGQGPHVDFHYMSFDASGRLLTTNDGGIFRLDNPTLGSLDWVSLNGNIQTTQFIGIAMDPTNLDLSYGGSQDNGTEKFTGFLGWTAIRGGDGGHVEVDPSNPLILYHTFQYPRTSGTWERSDNGGSSWSVKQTGINTSDPGNFYVPLILDPSSPTRLLTGTNRVYETIDKGENWVPLSTPSTNGWGTGSAIDAIGLSATDTNVIWACAGGAIYFTSDHGANWALRNAGTSVDHFHDIAVDPTDHLTAYVARDRFGVAGKVFKTTNAGVLWTNISSNLPDIPAQSIIVDPNNPGQADDVLYVGTDTGVFRSTNGGASWTVHATGMPNCAVFDLDLNPTTGVLMAGTHGRGTLQILTPTSPSVAALSDAVTLCGSAYTGPTPSGSGSPPLTWSLVAGPGGMTIDSGTGIVSWPTPIPSLTDYTVTIKAENDGGGFDTKTYLLTVKPGDFNGDGLADPLDLPDFVDHLLGVSNTRPCAADVNNDTFIDGLDAQAWIISSATP
ncbi:MAG: dockerin type I domain-containing protein [Planctomycetota bacterium]